jgi:hypothetical protein
MANNELISFLTDMKEKLENEQISDDELQIMGEFYMLCKFKQEFAQMKAETDEKDLIKFLMLGWYFYCILQTKEVVQV